VQASSLWKWRPEKRKMLKNEIVIEQGSDLRPRWYRIATARRLYDLSVSKLYQLLNAGALETLVLKEKGKQKGLRMISAASLEKYFAGEATTQWNPMKGGRPKKNGAKAVSIKAPKNGSPSSKRKAVAK
jgi:hypothetical protein